MKKSLLILTFTIFMVNAFAQSLKPVAQKIHDLMSSRNVFTEVALFEVNNATSIQAMGLSSIVTGATVMEFNQSVAQQLLLAKPEHIRFIIPSGNGQYMELELFRSGIFTPDFSVTTSSANGQAFAYTGGLHYWGIISGNNASIAAISIFDTEVMGMISAPGMGNLVLGRLENDVQYRHILYNDANLLVQAERNCFTADNHQTYTKQQITPQQKTMVNCIRLFWEVNYDIYQNKGSVTNAANYVTGLFNQSAIIYTNDGIPVELSEVYVWNTPSPYTATTTSGQLALFKSTRNSINGDLGHLLGLVGGGGVAAGFNGICNVNLDNSQCYSMVYTSFSNVPTYSWSVMVVSHEQGHLMGSRHTHACVWNGNNTAIDNCGPTSGYGYEGSCNNAPTPVGGGTIMSYCHLNVGINFSNGFGPQPAAVIINNYTNGACLTACIGMSCMPSASMTTSNVTTTTATFTWNPVSGATLYTVRYRITGNPTWTTDTTSSTTYNATGLSSGSNYEWQVQTDCGGGSSIFTISTTFVTIPLTCNVPGGTTTTNTGPYSATLNWTAVGGALNYSLLYRMVGSPTWTAVTVNGTSYNVSGLTHSTNYEWQVRTNCVGGAISSYSPLVFFTTQVPPCLPPQNIYTTSITDSSATLNWGPVAGASGYYVRYRIVGTTTWTNAFASLATSYTLTGLQSSGNYEWQMLISCTGGQSPWGYSSLFTTLCTAPVATISANGPVTFCIGGSVLLTASSGIGYAYQWFQNGTLLPGMVSMNYPASASGSYTVLVTSGSCLDTSSAVTVTVHALPAVSFTGLDTSYLITAAPVTLTGSPAGGTFSGQGISGNSFDPVLAGVGGPYTITYSYTDGNNCSNTQSQVVTVVNCQVPAQPGAITVLGGAAKVCPGDVRTYRVNNVSGVTFTWIPPAGAVITNGQGTNKVDVSFTAGFTANSLIIVTASNVCGPGLPKSRNVNRNVPSKPVAITGPSSVCANQQLVPYSIVPVANATAYKWTAPNGSKISDGVITSTSNSLITTTTAVTINFKTTAGNVAVKGSNGCGFGSAKTLPVAMPCRIDESQALSVAVYPNPSSGDFIIALDGISGTGITIRVYDAMGRLVVSEGSAETTVRIQNEKLVTGIYMAVISDGVVTRQVKLVKTF